MADDPQTPPAQTESILSSSGAGRASPSSGAIIANSQNFTITGGQFTNIVNCAPTVPSNFRMIPLGDLDLRNEIRLEGGRVVNQQHRRCAARRIYTTRIDGRQSDMTVAVYEGENAEETWKRELSKYSGLRHPNIVQVYGAVNSAGLYATIFHEDLMPLKQFVDEYRHSVMSFVYLYAYFNSTMQRSISILASGNLGCSVMTPYLGYGARQVDSVSRLHLTSLIMPSHTN
ncbi:hypothetical protein C8R44DRAFT_259256 [Mycena epipterygia]|nr:hypothetical protein C8R44DRAFT_259256 [Mycena epipterygia]